MDFQAELSALALELLNEFGGPAQLVRSSGGGFDRKAGREIATTNTTIPVQVALSEVETTDEAGRKAMRSNATLLVEPRQGDRLIVGGRTFVVGDTTTLTAQNMPVIYKAVVR